MDATCALTIFDRSWSSTGAIVAGPAVEVLSSGRWESERKTGPGKEILEEQKAPPSWRPRTLNLSAKRQFKRRNVSQPESPQWYPPPPPPKQGLSTGAIIAIVVAVVVVVIVVGAVIAGAFYSGIQQASNLPPNVVVTNAHSSYYENCGAFGTQTTRWDWSATLVNTGGSGFADVGFDVNGQQVTQNTYYVAASYQT